LVVCICSIKAFVTAAACQGAKNKYWSNGFMAPNRDRKPIIKPDGLRSKTVILPAVSTKRWVIRRKAQVVSAVRKGVLSLEEACDRYMLTADEFAAWERAIDEHGLAGLRTTRLQHYRARRDQSHPLDQRRS
jgi:hypothetical protein